MDGRIPGEACETVDDDAAVRAVIERETRSFMARDFEAWSACWTKSARTTDCYAGSFGTLAYRGWDMVAGGMRQVMAAFPEPLSGSPAHADFSIVVGGDLAWATFRSACHASGERHAEAFDTFEARVLERHGDRWLIALSCVLAARTGRLSGAWIMLDADGRVRGARGDGRAALRDHAGLTISAGRLRATRRSWDKVLQRAIRRAGEAHRLFHFAGSHAEGEERYSFPVVLGRNDAGGVDWRRRG